MLLDNLEMIYKPKSTIDDALDINSSDLPIQSRQNKQEDKKRLNVLIKTSYLASILIILGSLYFCNIDRTDKNYPRLELFPLSLGAGAGGLVFHYGRRKEEEFNGF
ncbi:hypothetical protein HYX19_01040 [Candidatus Woesearchaeota archaeon]|nr:hypothetical protein [Candidatus Woesearchaeota archaeon]